MSEVVRIGKKSQGAYISAVLYAFKHGHNPVVVAGLGGQVEKAFDVCDKIANILDLNGADTQTFEKNGLLGVRITLRKR